MRFDARNRATATQTKLFTIKSGNNGRNRETSSGSEEAIGSVGNVNTFSASSTNGLGGGCGPVSRKAISPMLARTT